SVRAISSSPPCARWLRHLHSSLSRSFARSPVARAPFVWSRLARVAFPPTPSHQLDTSTYCNAFSIAEGPAPVIVAEKALAFRRYEALPRLQDAKLDTSD